MTPKGKNNREAAAHPSLKTLLSSVSIYRYCWKAIELVWATNRKLTIAIALMSLFAGLLPGAVAYIGKLIVDAVIVAAQTGTKADLHRALEFLVLEAIVVIAQTGIRQAQMLAQNLLRALLGQKVNELILEKALTLSMAQFEDSEFYDKMTRARREASSRPLSLVGRTFGLIQDLLSLLAFGGLLLKFSGWAVLILVVAAIPAFVAETRFAGHAFRLMRWQSQEHREQVYLETLIAREDAATEVKLYQLGPTFLKRYRSVFQNLYRDDRNLTLQRGLWRYLLGLLSTAAFYVAYVWIVVETIAKRISLGDLTMYLVVFRQGQTTVSNILSGISSMYEDSLYLSNLYEFLDEQVEPEIGHAICGEKPGDGLRFEGVFFTYPDSDTPALSDVTFHLSPGQKLAIVGENGSGKTTLIKLLTRLYRPTLGRIFLDGTDLTAWDVETLQQRIGVIFQNFVKYQFTVGENIGAGDVTDLDDESRWREAAEKSTASPVIDSLPEGYQTRLGKWFKGGRELSGGQWQKIALARAFMRVKADILVLDEPTSAMDPEAEVEIFEQFRAMTPEQMAILISHRFSTVRMADQILVLNQGRVLEQGTHDELVRSGQKYARLFKLQAAGYQ
jgi:ABC-type multidrug transport system fused ATPase/permease subunit